MSRKRERSGGAFRRRTVRRALTTAQWTVVSAEHPERERRVRTARTIFQWKIVRSERPERERRAAPPLPPIAK